MGTQVKITRLLSPQVGLVQTSPVHVRGKRWVQQGLKVLSQQCLSDSVAAVAPLTEIEVSNHENGFLVDIFIQ